MGVVVLAPFLGGPKLVTQQRMNVLYLALIGLDVLAAAWLIAQYAFQVNVRASAEKAWKLCCNLSIA